MFDSFDSMHIPRMHVFQRPEWDTDVSLQYAVENPIIKTTVPMIKMTTISFASVEDCMLNFLLFVSLIMIL